ncbi:unnamed protein product [Symbiodinium natans]|uniref:Uncharacterized protein n=1 Tax=Symbiodinium natans TaxID=878477 RepID=A0A812HYR9_9DINO|nr:unnamed protein product [Symbiodinium natans]
MPNIFTWILFSVRDCLGQGGFEKLSNLVQWSKCLFLAKLGSKYLLLLMALRMAGAWLWPPLTVVKDADGWPMVRSLTPQERGECSKDSGASKVEAVTLNPKP